MGMQRIYSNPDPHGVEILLGFMEYNFLQMKDQASSKGRWCM
jgi:hypothetical protein